MATWLDSPVSSRKQNVLKLSEVVLRAALSKIHQYLARMSSPLLFLALVHIGLKTNSDTSKQSGNGWVIVSPACVSTPANLIISEAPN